MKSWKNKRKQGKYALLIQERKIQKPLPHTYTAVEIVNEAEITEEFLVTEASQSSELVADDNLILNETEKLIRVILDGSQRVIPLIDETYSIMSEVRSIVDYLRKPETFLEPDDTVPICEGSTYTKGEWTREYYSICNKFILPQETQRDILNLIFNTFGEKADLPVALTTHGKKRFKRKFGGANNDEEEDTSSDDNSISAPNTLSKVKGLYKKSKSVDKTKSMREQLLRFCRKIAQCIWLPKMWRAKI